MFSSPARRLTAPLTFLLPCLVFLALCAAMGFAPFGDSSILIFDLSDQFVEFLCGLKHGQVYFSWSNALGGSYIGTFSYYVSSPFSLLTLLCPDEAMPIAVVFLVALKLGLAGLTFGLLLRRRTSRYDLTTAAFSLCYGLMAYNIAYAMSFMWLDGVIWLPVLLMGVEDLLDGRRPWVLLGGLVVSFLSTWYISYMTGLFCALYLLWQCACRGMSPGRSLAKLGQLVLWAGLALALTAWLWLPTALSMFSGKLAGGSASFSLAFNWPLTTLLYKLLVPGAYDSVTYTGSAFLYCSLLAALLAAVWFFLPAASRRAKLATLALGAFLALSLWFTPLDTVWHLFQRPNSFPGRWSFVVSCFILLVAYDGLLWLLGRVRRPRLSALLPGLLAAVMLLDMGGSALMMLRALDRELGFESYASYHDYKQTLQPLVDQIREEGGFVRVNSDLARSRNEAQAFGYQGLTFFSSSYNQSVNDLLGDLGYAQAWFWSTSFGATPVSDLLLGVGWHITGGAAPVGYSLAGESGGARLYRSDASPSPAYAAAVSLEEVDWSGNCFQRQNSLLAALSGLDDACFLPLDPRLEEGTGTALWTFQSDGSPVYALFPKEGDSAHLTVNGQSRDIYTNETDCILYLGTFPAGQTVEVKLDYQGGLGDVLFYALDTGALARAQEVLDQNRLEVTGFGNGWVEGNVTAGTDTVLYTSIPAIPGWSVTVDGQEVSAGSFRDTLLTVPLTAGTHTVSLHYTPPGLLPGLVLAAGGLAALLVLLLRARRGALRPA